MYGLRVRVFSHLQRLSMDFYTESKAGVLLSRMTSDIESLSVLLQEGFVNLMVQALTLVFVTAVLFYYNVELALVVVVVVVPPLLALTLWFRSASSRGYDAIRDRVADVLADLSENLAGIRVVVSSNRQAANSAEHRRVVGRYRDANLVTARAGALYGPASEGIGLVAQAVVLLVGGRMVLRGDLELGELAAFVLYVTTFFAPIQQLVQLYNTYQQGQAAIRKLDGLLAEEPVVRELPGAPDLPRIEGRIELRGVTFSYRAGQPVLRDVDLVIEAGETFALVGDTGAGKSTIARLISRFHDPDEGAVLIDGHDLTTVTLRSLRSQLGMVPQEPYLFDGTIRDNLAFARPDASDEELAEAVRLVGLDDLVERLPDGIDAVVHERGATLSAGERQLLALGRAFLARPRVLVLDEATSSLDLASEAKVERALDALVEGRTAVLIAHRLSTARKADRIAVVRDGRLAAVGRHDELVHAGGWYAEAWARWERSGHAAVPGG
jgi:ATP-binding cassette subfamily B protein